MQRTETETWFQVKVKRFAKILTNNHKLFGASIVVMCCAIAGLDSLTPPEVPIESLYAFPIYLALYFFSWGFGLAITLLTIGLFTVSNFLIGHDSASDIAPSIILSLVLFLLFARGAYQFILNQRQLAQVQNDLQTRLKELEKLYQESQLLHQQNLKLAVSEERNRLAREIHDVLAQGLAAIIFQGEAAFANRDKPEILEERLAQIIDLAHHNLQEARRSVANLRPLQLDNASLTQALHQRVETWSRDSGVPARFSTSGEVQILANEVERALYRIAQEALTNVARHAAASEVQVTLDYDEEEVWLTIQDNGKGFDREQSLLPGLQDSKGTSVHNQLKLPKNENGASSNPGQNKFGLQTMEERASLVGGWTTVQSKPGQGCRVRVIVPYNKALSALYLDSNSNPNGIATLSD